MLTPTEKILDAAKALLVGAPSITPHTATIRGGAEIIGDAYDDMHDDDAEEFFVCGTVAQRDDAGWYL